MLCYINRGYPTTGLGVLNVSLTIVINLGGSKGDTGLAEEIVFALQTFMKIDEAKLAKLKDSPGTITPQDLEDISLEGLSLIDVRRVL